MTFAPASLLALGTYWEAHGGVNLGIVGDTDHAARGVSYHLGRDQLTPDAYSRQTTRDKAGLTNAASAIDLGRLDGSLTSLRTFSEWLVKQGRTNAPGTKDIREIIYSPDGMIVLRWDRERGYQSAPRAGEADNSHLTHTHVSYYRDAEARDKVDLFSTYGEFMLIPASEPLPHSTVDVSVGDAIYETPQASGKITKATAPRTVPGLFRSGPYVAVQWPSPGTPGGQRLVYFKIADVTVHRGVEDCADEIAADRAKAHIVYDE